MIKTWFSEIILFWNHKHPMYVQRFINNLGKDEDVGSVKYGKDSISVWFGCSLTGYLSIFLPSHVIYTLCFLFIFPNLSVSFFLPMFLWCFLLNIFALDFGLFLFVLFLYRILHHIPGLYRSQFSLFSILWLADLCVLIQLI